MNQKDALLFGDEPLELGFGYHNIASGVFRYAHSSLKETIEKIYGQRCGHIPLNAKTVGVIVDELTEDVRSQIAYLSELYGRDIKLLTSNSLNSYKSHALVVPYIRVPEAEAHFTDKNVRMWGIPGKLTHVLKNKSEFCHLVKELNVEGFQVPDYITTYLAEVIPQTNAFLKKIESWYEEAGLRNSYPLGVMLRASDEDGNYGASLMYEKGRYVVMIPNGEVDNARVYGNWEEALVTSKRLLTEAMMPQKEPRVVVSRYVDTVDSPGMSIVLMNGSAYSLGWNVQTRKTPSRNPIAAGTYNPVDPVLKHLQDEYESESGELLGKFLRAAAGHAGVDFNTIRGIANIDLILPTALEKTFQERRGIKTAFYFSECNPRWTTYTDAVMTILGLQKKPQTINNMLQVIQEGIAVIDRYKLPKNVEPRLMRELIYKKDKELQKHGTRLICRMTTNPMGIILAGDIALAQTGMKELVRSAASEAYTAPAEYLFT